MATNFHRKSVIGPKRTSLVASHMSAFGGKADMAIPGKMSAPDQFGLQLGFDIRRQFAAVGSELCHDLLVQPDIHLG